MVKKFNLHQFKIVMKAMGSRRFMFYIFSLITAISTAMPAILVSLIFKDVINSAVDKNIDLLKNTLTLVIIYLVVMGIIIPLGTFITNVVAKTAFKEIRSKTHKHMLNLPQSYYDKHHQGEVLSVLTNDLNKYATIYDGAFFQALSHFLIGSICLTTIFILDWHLSIIVVVLGISGSIINSLFVKPTRKSSQKIQRNLGRSTNHFLDLVLGNRMIKLFNRQSLLFRRFDTVNSELKDENIHLSKIEAIQESVTYILSGLSYMAIIGVGAYMVISQKMNLGTVVAIFSLKPGVDDLFLLLINDLVNLQKSLAGVERVEQLQKEREEENKGCYIKKGIKFPLKLDKIHFGYDNQMILRDLDLTLESHKKYVVKGPSGVGKTTLMKVILGLLKPSKGEVLIETENEPSINELRSQIAYVAQHPYLFPGTVKENILYGNLNASDEEVISAARKANAHQFIVNLQNGYETLITNDDLSGGERQRIALARAILKDTPIYLLDEPTSAIDAQNKYLIQEALRETLQDKIIVLITHGKTHLDCDVTYELINGKCSMVE